MNGHFISRRSGLLNLINSKSSNKTYCFIIIYYQTINLKKSKINKLLLPLCDLRHA